VPDYPAEALRELVINSVLHRLYELGNSRYSDHVEIDNAGSLYGKLTPEAFGRETAYRNEVLAEVMKGFGDVHKFGSGIPMVRQALKVNGNPSAEFTFFVSPVFILACGRLVRTQPFR
jgi:ATP-dependent DNA helicase RecG